ncbi:unnamed protein product, partial [Hapterophycus canaliculatus]
QGYVQCDGCKAWQHLECAGTTAEDVEDAGGAFTCQDCVDDAATNSSSKSAKTPAKARKPSFAGS